MVSEWVSSNGKVSWELFTEPVPGVERLGTKGVVLLAPEHDRPLVWELPGTDPVLLALEHDRPLVWELPGTGPVLPELEHDGAVVWELLGTVHVLETVLEGVEVELTLKRTGAV